MNLKIARPDKYMKFTRQLPKSLKFPAFNETTGFNRNEILIFPINFTSNAWKETFKLLSAIEERVENLKFSSSVEG